MNIHFWSPENSRAMHFVAMGVRRLLEKVLPQKQDHAWLSWPSRYPMDLVDLLVVIGQPDEDACRALIDFDRPAIFLPLNGWQLVATNGSEKQRLSDLRREVMLRENSLVILPDEASASAANDEFGREFAVALPTPALFAVDGIPGQATNRIGVVFDSAAGEQVLMGMVSVMSPLCEVVCFEKEGFIRFGRQLPRRRMHYASCASEYHRMMAQFGCVISTSVAGAALAMSAGIPAVWVSYSFRKLFVSEELLPIMPPPDAVAFAASICRGTDKYLLREKVLAFRAVNEFRYLSILEPFVSRFSAP